MLLKRSFFFISILLAYINYAQIERGTILPYTNVNTQQFYDNNYLNIEKVRQLTNFLTDANIQTYKGDTLPKRKKAFIRHIKHLSEKIEYDYFNSTAHNADQEEILSELLLFKHSLIHKTQNKAHPKVRLSEKIKMVYNTFTSKQRLKVRIPSNTSPIDSIVESPYWHSPVSTQPLHKQFAYLARQKKIKHQKNIVVIFKSLSLSGSAPKVNTYDLDLDNEWSLKWGDEIHTDIVGSRIFAALGYDVDHPYFYEKEKLTLIFDDFSEVHNKQELQTAIKDIYNIDLLPFIYQHGTVIPAMAVDNPNLTPFIGKQFVQFIKCAIEARPDRVKRIGSFVPELNTERKELRAALLAHQFIGNWDTRKENTLLTTVHNGNYQYQVSAVFSDLGTSLGVYNNYLPPDFKVGLVNQLPWEAVKKKGQKISFTNKINAVLSPYKEATYEDLLWMAKRIAQLNEQDLKMIIKKAHWPTPIATLYFHKLASRRASILNAFNLTDPHPIVFDKAITIIKKEKTIVKNGVLLSDYKPRKNPESFYRKKGRLRNYGH